MTLTINYKDKRVVPLTNTLGTLIKVRYEVEEQDLLKWRNLELAEEKITALFLTNENSNIIDFIPILKGEVPDKLLLGGQIDNKFFIDYTTIEREGR